MNDQRVKPHRHLAVGDEIEIEIRDWIRILVVRELRDKPLPKKEAARLFEDLSPPKPEPDPWTRLMRQTPERRAPGLGRPTKKERRELDRWKRR